VVAVAVAGLATALLPVGPAAAALPAGPAAADPPVGPTAAMSPPAFIKAWGGYGSGPGKFDQVRGLALDGSGHLYAVDPDNHRIQKFSTDGAFLDAWGGSGTTNGKFDDPWDVAFGAANNAVYVTDQPTHRVQEFSPTGAFRSKFGTAADLPTPWGIAVGNGGDLYVVDSHAWAPAVRVFSSTGNPIRQWGQGGIANGEFNSPAGIAADTDGNVYVADLLNDRIQKFDPDGKHLLTFGTSGSGDGQLSQPVGVALDRSGNLYVTDSKNDRVVVFSSTGAFLTKWGSTGSRNGQFVTPWGIAVDAVGNVYVADRGNNRIQKFGPAPTRRPDGRVGVGAAPLVGNDVYNTTGAGQSVAAAGKPGRTVAFKISIQNDGSGADSFKVKAGGSSAAYAVKYLKGATDITAAVVGGRYRTASLAKGAATTIVARVTIKPSAAVGSSLARPVTITSVGDGTKKDVVRYTARRG
jgi:sugar lactone lactonase YvrE